MENMLIECNVIRSAFRNNVKKLMFLGSACIYPKLCPQPIREEYLLTGALEPTNEAYAIAKISGIKMCQSYNKQYGTRYLCHACQSVRHNDRSTTFPCDPLNDNKIPQGKMRKSAIR